MRKFLTYLFLLASFAAIAQPMNDDCDGIIDLGVAPWCDETVFFDNIDATPTDIGTDNVPSINDCSGLGPMENDVWFVFIASDTIDEYLITVTGITDGMGSVPMVNPQVAIYRGDCEFDGLQLLDCGAADLGENVATLNVSDLTPGLPYFLRITDYSATAMDNEGTFQLCIEELTDIPLCEDIVTTACTGVFFDCGGPDEDYGPNETVTLTIMPPAPVGCITLTLDYYNIENGSDNITFYDGPSTASPQITNVTGGAFGTPNDGGTSFTVTASSGALTMQFVSDGNVEFEGFAGSWECSSEPCPPDGSVSLDSDITETDIIDAVSTPFTTVSNVVINCPEGSYGTFESDNSDIGLDKGIVLISGDNVGNIDNPANFFSSGFNGGGEDPDLTYLSNLDGNGQPSQDACIIEMDVFAATDELSFEYVFGSEEYPGFINSSFNDIFALLISGPGIVGDPNIGNQANLAVLPAPGTGPVSVVNVNQEDNWEFYRSNLNSTNVVYGGLTGDYLGVKQSLTAISAVEPCNTYHLKFAIADRGDTAYDSGVFVSELKGGTPDLGVNYQNGIEYLVEECLDTPDEIVLSLSSPQDEPVTYDIVVMGTATPGVDYTLNLPAQITFNPGETEFTFPIEALADGIPEGVETIEITLQNDFGCGTVNLVELTILIYDELEVEIFAGEDTAYVCDGNSIEMNVEGAVSYFWTPTNIFDPATGSNPIATPTDDIMVYVVGQLGVCTAIDSVYLDVVAPTISIQALTETDICVGDTVQLLAINNVGDSNIEWTPSTGIVDPNANPVTIIPTDNTTYTVNVELEGCGATDSYTVNVDYLEPAVTNFSDTTICENYSVTLGQPEISGSGTTYQWSPADFLDFDDIPNAVATPEAGDYTYTIISTSENAFCADTSVVNVEVLPADVEIIEPDTDTLEICLGTSVDLSALTTTPGMGLNWTPDDGSLSSTTAEDVIATPTQSTTYLATLEVGACMVFDSIYIRVDSLPESGLLETIPDKESYCQGELVTLVFPTYEPFNFPDIEHMWTPDLGLQSPDSLWNLVFQATETATYTRITTNRACIDTTEVLIEVVPTAEITIEPANPSICFGEDVQLVASSDDDVTGWMWSPASTLDQDDIPNPVASPLTTTTYTVEGEFDGCPTAAEVTVEVEQLTVPVFPSDRIICPGESILLNTATDPDAIYTWLVDGQVVSNDPEYEVSPTETTTYILLVEKAGCELELEITVTVLPQPTLTVGNDTLICTGFSAQLSASSNVEGTFSWMPDADDVPNPIVTPGSPTMYYLTFTDDEGCLNQPLQDSVFVDVTDGFNITNLTADPDTVYENSPLLLEVTTDPISLNNPNYFWTLEGVEVGDNNPTIGIIAPETDQPDGEFVTYQIDITDELGCSGSETIDVFVLDSEINVPTAFSPNGDGLNDVFMPVANEGVLIVEFRVYNRWGDVVYDINEDGGEGWDGMQNDKPAPEDVYAFYLVYRNGVNGEDQIWGDKHDPDNGIYEYREISLLR
ncbi:MAG: T9SS type B sorting domain-containing protein [Bacteroidetes bacterium]|nr:T9SS type B sorting domain-containing protein [Bacteroidota bacterium]